jgi:chromosome partitioning protein
MIIVMASAKGGVGKTTLSLCLSEFIATQAPRQRVMLHDADRNQTVLNFCRRGGTQSFTVAGLDDHLDPDTFDHLVIDSPADPGDQSLSMLMQSADLLIVPTGITIFDLEAAIATADRLDLPAGKYTLLINMVDPRATTTAMNARAAIENAGIPCCDNWIYRRSVYGESALRGVTINRLKGKPAAMAWADCTRAFKSILKGVG